MYIKGLLHLVLTQVWGYRDKTLSIPAWSPKSTMDKADGGC